MKSKVDIEEQDEREKESGKIIEKNLVSSFVGVYRSRKRFSMLSKDYPGFSDSLIDIEEKLKLVIDRCRKDFGLVK